MRYTIDFLPNGLITVLCRRSKSRGTYNANGTYRHGDLRLTPEQLETAIAERFNWPTKQK